MRPFATRGVYISKTMQGHECMFGISWRFPWAFQGSSRLVGAPSDQFQSCLHRRDHEVSVSLSGVVKTWTPPAHFDTYASVRYKWRRCFRLSLQVSVFLTQASASLCRWATVVTDHCAVKGRLVYPWGSRSAFGFGRSSSRRHHVFAHFPPSKAGPSFPTVRTRNTDR